jgi:hypothetical protein
MTLKLAGIAGSVQVVSATLSIGGSFLQLFFGVFF